MSFVLLLFRVGGYCIFFSTGSFRLALPVYRKWCKVLLRLCAWIQNSIKIQSISFFQAKATELRLKLKEIITETLLTQKQTINSEWAAISDAADYETSASFLLDCEFQLDSITREFEQSLNKLESYLGRNISDASIIYCMQQWNSIICFHMRLLCKLISSSILPSLERAL